MGPMPRATTRRHPSDQLIHAIRAALFSTIRAECPEVLENLRDAVFNPLIHSAMPREAIVALLCSLRPPRGVTQRRDAGTSAGRRDTMTQARRPSTRTRQTPIQSLDDLTVWVEGAWAR